MDWPGARKTLSKPLRLNGALLADAGGEVYNCGICHKVRGEYTKEAQSQKQAYLRSGDSAIVGNGERHSDNRVMQPMNISSGSYMRIHADGTHQGSKAAPGPLGWRVPPAVEPLIFRFE